MQRFDGIYRVKRANGLPEPLTEKFFDLRFQDIDLRVDRLEGLDISWQAALLQVRGEVLTRSEQVISDLRDKLIALTQLQWLTALSGTEVTLDAGELQSFAIDADYRDLFTPGPFVLLSRAATPNDYAVARTSLYDRESGQLIVETLVITGDPGPHSDWVISAIAGSTLAQLELLNQALALQATLLAARDDALAAAAAASDDAGATAADRIAVAGDRTAVGLDKTATVAAKGVAVEAAVAAAFSASSISGGPVTSVAGLTGIIAAAALKTAMAIAMSDVAGLSAALAGKATPSDITAAINALVASAPGQLDTINELAAALGNDANFAASVTAALAAKANAADVLSRSRVVARAIAYGG